MSKLDTAGYLAYFLKAQGLRYVYGHPGGDNLRVIDALREVGIDYILTHHEGAAGFMADADGQYHGRPGVCMATLGPGAVNMLDGVANTFREHSPVLAITADINAEERPRRTHQEIDINGLYRPATKFTAPLTADGIPELLPYAWRLARTPPWGPVHFTLTPAEAGRVVWAPMWDDRLAPPTTELALPDLTEAIQWLQKTRRVIIVAGIGVEQADAQPALLALAEAWGAPVSVTPKAKGHFPEDHPLFAGTYGVYGDEPLRAALEEADLVLAVGLDGIDFIKNWTFPTPVISLAAAEADDPTYRPALAYNGPLPQMLEHLIGARTGDESWWARAIREAIAARLAPREAPPAGTVAPQTVIQALREALPPEGILTIDVGAHKLLTLQAWQATLPKTLFSSNGLSAMGYAVPAAIALKLAASEVPVAAIAGDGGILMYAGELETLARVGHPIVVVVMADSSLALIHMKQKMMGQAGGYGTDFGGVDYRALAGAFGLAYHCLDEERHAADVLQAAVVSQQPVLVEARIDKYQYRQFHQL